jgi:pimeloyl-ACP methyl ester carboxylesterase
MTTTGLSRLEPLQNVRAGILEVAYYQAGPADGDPVLLHGFPYDIHSYEGMIPRLADGGLRVHVPYLRGAQADPVPRPVQPAVRPAGRLWKWPPSDRRTRSR